MSINLNKIIATKISEDALKSCRITSNRFSRLPEVKMKLLVFIGVLAAVISSSFSLRGDRLQGRIVGGDEIRIEEAPYQASLRYFDFHICGGAIISETFVITAAHCAFGRLGKYLSVLVGATNKTDDAEIHNVLAVSVHPNFNSLTYDYDVALLQLQTSIRINDITKQEITLPVYGEALPEKTPVLVSGWGNED